MPRIAYGAAAYRRDNGNLPELRLINMFLERTPNEESGVVLLSREGLNENSDVGAGPILGVYSEAGVFGGDIFRVSGGRLYRDSTDLGAVTGSGPVSWAGRDGELLVTLGATLYSYNGTNLAAVTFPESYDVAAVTYHDGLFLAVASGTQRWYWSAVLDGRDWDALDFASAERRADDLLDLAVTNDTLWLFGEESAEPWANTGDADAPYQRFEQRIFDKGVIGTGCIARLDNSLVYAGSDGMVYRLAETPQRISDHGIEERVGQSATVSAFGYVHQGHTFYCLRLDEGTFAFDISTNQWGELQSYGRDNFRGQCATMQGTTPLFGDDETGQVWTLSGHEDDGGTLERLFTWAFPIRGGTVTVDNFQIEANVGWTDLLTGQGSAPAAEMRSSRDAGATFGTWRQASLGAQGNYRTKAQWRRCGMFDWPGAMGEVRCTDPIPFRISAVTVNEPGGGRSR